MTYRLGLMASVAAAALFVAGCGDETCTSDTDCAANEFCNASGQCEVDNVTEECTLGGCVSPQVCDITTQSCIAAASCTADDTNQPDTACKYGLFCNAGTCAEVPLAKQGTCTNYGTGAHALAWGPGSTGPVIYKIVNQTTVADSTFCGSTPNFRYRITVYAYHPTGDFPASDGTQHGADETAIEGMIHLVRPDGSEITTTNTIQDLLTTNGGGNAKFTVNYCRSTGGAYSAGVHFTGGNEVCQSVPGP